MRYDAFCKALLTIDIYQVALERWKCEISYVYDNDDNNNIIEYIKEDHLSLCLWLSDRAIKTFSCRHGIIRCMHIILMQGV